MACRFAAPTLAHHDASFRALNVRFNRAKSPHNAPAKSIVASTAACGVNREFGRGRGRLLRTRPAHGM